MTRRLIVPRHEIDDEDMYVLLEDYDGITAILGLDVLANGWQLMPDGRMTLFAGFRWNGPDIVLDTPKLLIPSALHDAGCYGLASGVIPQEKAPQVHYTYRDAMKTWRVPWIRRKVQFRAVFHGHKWYSWFGGIFGAD